jgi:UDP-N-acetylglucosamine 3-dehydrogenase
MTTVKIALVGIGRMGRNHLRILRETPGFELCAVVDADAPRPDDLADIPFFRDVAALADLPIDAAVVATPTATHFEVGRKLLADGKHLLIEKPIASTYDQARTLIEEAISRGRRLAVGHVERFNPAVRKLRQIIGEGWLGTPIHFSFTRVGGYPETILEGNNVLLDLAVHDIDVLRSMVGPVRLESSMCHSTWRAGTFDTAEILLSAAAGSSATVHVNWITPTKIRSVRVTGTRGVCFVDYILQTCELLGGNLLKRLEPLDSSFRTIQDVYRNSDRIQFGVQKEEPLRVQARQFHQFVTEGAPGELCTGQDAVAAVLLAERAVQADNSRKRPSVLPAREAMPESSDDWV